MAANDPLILEALNFTSSLSNETVVISSIWAGFNASQALEASTGGVYSIDDLGDGMNISSRIPSGLQSLIGSPLRYRVDLDSENDRIFNEGAGEVGTGAFAYTLLDSSDSTDPEGEMRRFNWTVIDYVPALVVAARANVSRQISPATNAVRPGAIAEWLASTAMSPVYRYAITDEVQLTADRNVAAPTFVGELSDPTGGIFKRDEVAFFVPQVLPISIAT